MTFLMALAATTATAAGYNCLGLTDFKECDRPRRVARIGLAGSAVAGDIKFQLYYGKHLVGEFYPTSVGSVFPDDDDMLAVSDKMVCPRGQELRLVASGPAVTNSVWVILDIKELY